jgi:hypothetical protein
MIPWPSGIQAASKASMFGKRRGEPPSTETNPHGMVDRRFGSAAYEQLGIIR